MRRLSVPRRPLLIAGLAIALMVAVGLLSSAHPVRAQDATTFSIESIGGQVGLGNADLKQVVIRIIQWALGFMILVAVGFIIYGGFIWMTAAGNEDRIEKAKRIIIQACIGLVIVLLAWAIVLFVARFFSGATNNGNTNNTNTVSCLPCSPGCSICPGDDTTFDITAIATCTDNADYSKGVPRSSKVAVYFNHGLNTTVSGGGQSVPEKAVADASLSMKKCANATSCDPTTMPAPLLNQQSFTVGKATSTETAPKTEWVSKANSNTMTFNHESYSTDPGQSTYRLFDATSNYRIYLPRKGAANALVDTTLQQKELEHCQSSSGGPIPGDLSSPANCTEDAAANNINWTFTTGQDVAGPPFKLIKTVPKSEYLTDTTKRPQRDLPRALTICAGFSGAADPSLVGPENIRVTRFTDPPTAGQQYQNGQLDTSALPASNFTEVFFPDPKRFCMTTKQWLEPFTWYRVEVRDVRNLCGTTMDPNPYTWVFETGSAVPGIRKIFPPDGFDKSCPATKVRVLFNTSMWNGAANNCNVNGGSYVTGGTLTTNGQDAGRTLRVVDQFNIDDPNASCKEYEFGPTTTLLNPGATYQAAVTTNMQIDKDGAYLEVGTPASKKPWSFSVVAADKCVNPPWITRISPTEGQDGQCVSVLGDNFEKQAETSSNGKPEAGDALTLGDRSQLNDPDLSWTNNSIVTTVDAGTAGSGGLERNRLHTYKVTVNYPAPIGPLSDELTDSFRLNEGNGSENVCLYSLSKASGPIGTVITATGKRFGEYMANQSRAPYGLAPGGNLDYVSGWTDKRIQSLRIPVNTTIGLAGVSVVASNNNQSNEINFQTIERPTAAAGAPRVEESFACDLSAVPQEIPSPNPKSGDQKVCLTTRPEVRFTKEMNRSILTADGNVVLADCTSGTCTPVNGVGVVVRGDNMSLQLNPPGGLLASHTYQVTIKGVVQSSANVPMGEDYVWQFQTQTDNSECSMAGVYIPEKSKTFRQSFNYPMSSTLRAAQCWNIAGSCSAYRWASDPTGLVDLLPDNAASTIASSVDNIQAGFTDVTAQCQAKTSNRVRLTYDPTFCTDDSACLENSFGEQCTGSTCQNNHCTPVVNRMVQDNGAPGTWTTIHGCWFDSYVAGQSKVVFGADQGASARDAADFNTQLCDLKGSWHNEWIVREVPNGAVTGRVKVIRKIISNQSAEALSSGNFTVNSIIRPNLCKVYPERGQRGSLVTVSGYLFGDDESADRPTIATNLTTRDAVLIRSRTDLVGTSERAMTTYGSWTRTVIGTAIPNEASEALSMVTVKNDTVVSNDVPFNVRTASQSEVCSQPCSGDDFVCPNTAGGLGQGCSVISNCCVPKPVITSTYPPNTSPGNRNICRNTAVSITFSLPLAAENVDLDHVVYRDNGVVPAQPKVNLANDNGEGTIVYQPGLLNPNTTQTLTIAPNAIRGVNGALADLTGLPLTFTTSNQICKLERVTIDPLTWTALGKNERQPYSAQAFTANQAPITSTPAYNWDWKWLSSDTKVAKLDSEAGTRALSFAFNDATAGDNGRATINACAKVTTNTAAPNEKPTICARSKVAVAYCPYPWTTPFIDSDQNCDVTGAGCGDYNFSMSYCRGSELAKVLPDFSYVGQSASTGVGAIEGRNNTLGRLKSIFFKESANATDAIGVLIYPNPQLLSPADWYAAQGFGGSSGNTIAVGDYPGFQVGTTVYVGVTNFTGTTMEGIMFVLDYNSNQAEGATKQVFNKLLSSISFNVDNLGSDVERAAVQRDTQRLQDMASVAKSLASYKVTNSAYPKLDAGSYLIGTSTSTWPSWEGTLGPALGKVLPVDPNNKFAKLCSNDPTTKCSRDDQCVGGTCSGASQCAVPMDPATCWSEPTQRFQCANGSSVYMYRSDGAKYDLYATMEYISTGSFANASTETNMCTGLSNADCRCFNYHLASPS